MISKAKIAERIIESILTRKLRPGERLGEQDIADLFNVSRTLVREALMQLQARGFVEVRSRIGWYVVEPSFDEARETYAARRVIEPGMLRDAGTPLQTSIRRLRQHLAEERKAIASGDKATRSWLLADFHICLAECLGNRFLTATMVDLSARTTLVSALYQTTTEAQGSNDDHAAIVAALADGDNARAERLMRDHIDSLAKRLDATLADRGDARKRLQTALAPTRTPRKNPPAEKKSTKP
ncbi:MAG: GntR family transcriptional regulator [Comamonadaceae bacterium]|nr:GntR family transcriptional regulator [Pseudomonadota bacterium]MBS0610449.1 GntR family transcriptional regulator [Pseudomonadota bacterium]MDE2414084.1 GntR family transcriptional regulator [Comamonadaceae bacterium]